MILFSHTLQNIKTIILKIRLKLLIIIKSKTSQTKKYQQKLYWKSHTIILSFLSNRKLITTAKNVRKLVTYQLLLFPMICNFALNE